MAHECRRWRAQVSPRNWTARPVVCQTAVLPLTQLEARPWYLPWTSARRNDGVDLSRNKLITQKRGCPEGRFEPSRAGARQGKEIINWQGMQVDARPPN